MSASRAERRREARERAKPVPGVHYAPPPSPLADLEPIGPGEHVWIVTAVHRVSEEGARRASAGVEPVLLDHESVVTVVIGCWLCERSYGEAAGAPCPGEPR